MQVTCKLYGGLGNQLYQMAAAIAYAMKYNIPYAIPRDTLNNSTWKPYHLPLINYTSQGKFKGKTYTHKEKRHSYTKLPYIKADTIVFDGYFQSYKYFEAFDKEILRLFGFPTETIPDVTSIHVRRGDYLKYPDKHPICTEDYYNKAIDMLDSHYLVFSDDISWCKQFFKGDKFTFCEINDPLQELYLMSKCENNIIANSTFSLWAAMANPNPDKIVITPHEDNWFGSANKSLDVSDLIPQSFNRIKY